MHVPEQEGSTRKDFFISYTADIRWAEWIAWQLEEEGYSVILQGWDFRPGANMVLELDRAVTTAHQTIVVLSPNYINALYTLPEWTAAFKRDTSRGQTPLLPVRVQACEVKGLLKQLISIDLVGLQEAAARKSLLVGVGRLRTKPTQSPPFPGSLPLLWHVPHERNPLFIGRESVLSDIFQTVNGGTIAAITPSLAVEPTRSIGKTQTAIEYIYRYRSDYAAVFWVQATSLEAFRMDILAIVQKLQVSGVAVRHPQQILTRLREWLATHTNWLFILDDVVEPRILGDIFPSHSTGHVLLTSRQRSVAAIAQLIEIDAMKPEEEELIRHLSQLVKASLQGIDKRLSLGLEEVTIGQATDNAIVLDDPAVSPYHAVIRLEKKYYWIIDLNSIHGTFVNHQRLFPHVPHRLEPGALIRVGKTGFVYGGEEQHLSPPLEEDTLMDIQYRESVSTVSSSVVAPRLVDPSAILAQAQQGPVPPSWSVFHRAFQPERSVRDISPLRVGGGCLILFLTLTLGAGIFAGSSSFGAIPLLSVLRSSSPFFTITLLVLLFGFGIILLGSALIFTPIWLHVFNRFRRSQEPFVGQLVVLTPDGVVEYDKQHTPLAVVSFTDLTDMDISFGISSQTWLHLSYQNGAVKHWPQMDQNVAQHILKNYLSYALRYNQSERKESL